jgi:type VI secretion system secreted protein Hcp
MAQVDMFLKIEGIEGESNDSKHSKEIELHGFFIEVRQTGTVGSGTGGMGAGRVRAEDFHFRMRPSKASPKLFLACANGEHIKSAKLTLRKAGKEQQEHLVYEFKHVLISSYKTSIAWEGDRREGAITDWETQLEHITFNFGSVDITYKEQKPDGTLGGAIKAGWEFTTNKAL